jgi:hypothetical protein
VRDSAFAGAAPPRGSGVGVRPGTARRAVRDGQDGGTAGERGPAPARGRRRAAGHGIRGDRGGRVVHPHPRDRRAARPGRPDVVGHRRVHRSDLGDGRPGEAAGQAAGRRHGTAVVADCRARGRDTAEPGGQPGPGPADALGPGRGRRPASCVPGRGLDVERRAARRPRTAAAQDGGAPARGRPSPVRDARDEEDEAVLALARRAAAEHQDAHGQPITRDALRARLGVSNQAASELLRQLRAGEGQPPGASRAA